MTQRMAWGLGVGFPYRYSGAAPVYNEYGICLGLVPHVTLDASHIKVQLPLPMPTATVTPRRPEWLGPGHVVLGIRHMWPGIVILVAETPEAERLWRRHPGCCLSA